MAKEVCKTNNSKNIISETNFDVDGKIHQNNRQEKIVRPIKVRPTKLVFQEQKAGAKDCAYIEPKNSCTCFENGDEFNR